MNHVLVAATMLVCAACQPVQMQQQSPPAPIYLPPPHQSKVTVLRPRVNLTPRQRVGLRKMLIESEKLRDELRRVTGEPGDE